jgi:hypothetical protein
MRSTRGSNRVMLEHHSSRCPILPRKTSARRDSAAMSLLATISRIDQMSFLEWSQLQIGYVSTGPSILRRLSYGKELALPLTNIKRKNNKLGS